MKHTHALITGQTGCGKTSLARQFLQLTPRALVLDPQDDYVDDPGVIACRTFRDLADRFLSAGPRGTFRLAYTPDVGRQAEGGFRAVMAMAYRAQMDARESGTVRPLGVFLEEASIYSSAGHAPEELDWLIRGGRKAGICVCSVVQTDVDIAKTIRRNIDLHVAMRQVSPAPDLRKLIPNLEDDGPGLETLEGPAMEPVRGRHYLAFPVDADPHLRWKAAVTP